jgi:5'-nucleotidase (lipoprotein e(P4) family)
VYRQTYRAATAAAEKLSAGKAKFTWAVILDVDETVLDNSDFQKRLSLSGQPYRPEAWNAWVGERSASALPGAREFVEAVQGMGGRVVLVTNRAQSLCAATEDNLRAQRVGYDRILCDRAGDEDKNGRFAAVRQGSDGNSPLEVLIWVGDNIKDFPSLNQQSTDGFTEFGSRYFALPNPMYGSWQGVPPR